MAQRRIVSVKMKVTVTLKGERSFVVAGMLCIPLDALVVLDARTFAMIEYPNHLMQEALEIANMRAPFHDAKIKSGAHGVFKILDDKPCLAFKLD